MSLISSLALLAIGTSLVPGAHALPKIGMRERHELAPRSTWQPAVGASWQISLSETINNSNNLDVDVYDIDLFENDASIIKALQDQGKKVICYFSAGSYEDWRPDASEFKDSDVGGGLKGWDEAWLKIGSANVRKIMEARMDIAAQKGCDAVDPDNVDGYSNEENDLGLTEADSVDYINFLSDAAHSRGLSMGLKNAGSIIDQVLDKVEFSVNEQCAQYNEGATYSKFIKAGKPVFHIEYPKGEDVNNQKDVTEAQKNDACDASGADSFSTVIKNHNLNAWVQFC